MSAHRDADTAPVSRLAELPLATIGTVVGIGAALIGGVLLAVRGASGTREPKGRGKTKRG